MKITDFGNPTTTTGAVTNMVFMGAVLGLETTNLVFNIKGYERSKSIDKTADKLKDSVDASQKRIDEAVYLFAPSCGITLKPRQQEAAPQSQPAPQPAPQQDYYAQPQGYYDGYQQGYQPAPPAQGQLEQRLQSSRR